MLHSRTFALLAAIALIAASTSARADQENAVKVTGEGLVEVAPDIAWLGFGVSARHPTVAEARDEVARGVARLIALAGAGLAPALLLPRWLGRRLGGHSGDSYGACVEWSETLALLLSGLLWSGLSLPAAG